MRQTALLKACGITSQGGHEFLTANRTLWVDADDGSDTTGDGTQERPFQTLSAALIYAHSRLNNGGYSITVDFLTDLNETDQRSHNICGDFTYGYRKLTIQNSLNKSVTLGQISVKGCTLYLDGAFTVVRNSGHTIHALTGGALYLAGNIIVQCDGNPCIFATNGGRILIGPRAVITCRMNAAGSSALSAVNGSELCHVNMSATGFTLNLEGVMRSAIALQNGSQALRFDKLTVNAENATVTEKYYLLRNSYFDTGGRGAEWLPGESDGTIDETSIIQ